MMFNLVEDILLRLPYDVPSCFRAVDTEKVRAAVGLSGALWLFQHRQHQRKDRISRLSNRAADTNHNNQGRAVQKHIPR